MSAKQWRQEVKERARRNRLQMTKAERLLWGHLRRRQLDGYRFRCQAPVKGLVLDFYCPAASLAIEVDGPYHAARGPEDRARDLTLEQWGIAVLRFSNDEVEDHLDDVLERLKTALVKTSTVG